MVFDPNCAAFGGAQYRATTASSLAVESLITSFCYTLGA